MWHSLVKTLAVYFIGFLLTLVFIRSTSFEATISRDIFSLIAKKIKYGDLIVKYSELLNIDPLLIVAIIRVESDFRAHIESNSGDVGLMQISRFWQRIFVNEGFNLKDPEQNIALGCLILKLYLSKSKNLKEALNRYNKRPDYFERVMKAYEEFHANFQRFD